MPIYEYECKECKNSFSKLVIKQDTKVECPNCKSDNVEKKMSKISSLSSGNTSTASCGSSGFS
ncbi:MAG: hypothetical protein PWQ25_1557 [Deferribacteres bacterium]|jgi:putative FmdB family regulatory protein|nr:hypothetical protein [Deferribacteraceae bacterium]MDK2792694.1 hypothetical protein [Deferribacteres bacterium]